MPEQTVLLTHEEAADVLRLSPRHVFELAKRGDLACVRVGRRVFYTPSDLQDFIRRHRSEGRAPSSCAPQPH